MQKALRLKRELKQLTDNPTEGICCYANADNLNALTATIMGPTGTPYEEGIFQLEIHVPDKYPFEPPRITFKTPVYHPNIDDAGRICLDLLKMPPSGNWKPTLSIKNVLDAIKLLLSYPNPDDPLMPDIANEYRHNRDEFKRKARKMVKDTNATRS